jgi:hypothetical protein
VQRWFTARVSDLHDLGYRLQCRRVATPTPVLLDWVRAGRGYRGAMLPTAYRKLHPGPRIVGAEVPDDVPAHAIGVTIDRLSAKTDEDLLMLDPWPGMKAGVADRGSVPATIEAAHRERNFHALVYYWTGWS